MHSKYNENLAESISMAIKDETEGKHFKKKDDSDMDSVDSFDEYLGSKFGTTADLVKTCIILFSI